MYESKTTEMIPIERMMAALNGEKPDRVPVHVYPRWAPLEYLGITFFLYLTLGNVKYIA